MSPEREREEVVGRRVRTPDGALERQARANARPCVEDYPGFFRRDRKMRLYLTARRDRRDELRTYRDELIAIGHTVTCSWLDDDAPEQPEFDTQQRGVLGIQGNVKSRAEMLERGRANRAFSEVMDCEGLIAFTDPQKFTFEESNAIYGGVLWQHRKKIWIVGKRYHRLHFFDDVPAYPTWQSFLRMMAGQAEMLC